MSWILIVDCDENKILTSDKCYTFVKTNVYLHFETDNQNLIILDKSIAFWLWDISFNISYQNTGRIE